MTIPNPAPERPAKPPASTRRRTLVFLTISLLLAAGFAGAGRGALALSIACGATAGAANLLLWGWIVGGLVRTAAGESEKGGLVALAAPLKFVALVGIFAAFLAQSWARPIPLLVSYGGVLLGVALTSAFRPE